MVDPLTKQQCPECKMKPGLDGMWHKQGCSMPPLGAIGPSPRYSVDQRSRDLAEYFLGEDREEVVYRDLAQQIQDCVEDFCQEIDSDD